MLEAASAMQQALDELLGSRRKHQQLARRSRDDIKRSKVQ
jgi:hypothetical protein